MMLPSRRRSLEFQVGMLTHSGAHLGNDTFLSCDADSGFVTYSTRETSLSLLPEREVVLSHGRPTAADSESVADHRDCRAPAANGNGTPSSVDERRWTLPRGAFESIHTSRDGRFSAILSPYSLRHRVLERSRQLAVYELRTTDTVRNATWHPEHQQLLIVLLQSDAVEVFDATQRSAGETVKCVTTYSLGFLKQSLPSDPPPSSARVSSLSLSHSSRHHSIDDADPVVAIADLTVVSSTATWGPVMLVLVHNKRAQVFALELDDTCRVKDHAVVLQCFSSPEEADRHTSQTGLRLLSPLSVRVVRCHPRMGQLFTIAVLLNDGLLYTATLTEAQLHKKQRHAPVTVRYCALCAPFDVSVVAPTVPQRVHEILEGQSNARRPSRPAASTPAPSARGALASSREEQSTSAAVVRPSLYFTSCHRCAQSDNILLYNIVEHPQPLLLSQDRGADLEEASLAPSTFLVAVPVWSEARGVWVLDPWALTDGAMLLPSLPPVSSGVDVAPAPLAIRVPFDTFNHSVVLGASTLFVVPQRYGANEASSIIATRVNIYTLLATSTTAAAFSSLAEPELAQPPFTANVAAEGTSLLRGVSLTGRLLLEEGPQPAVEADLAGLAKRVEGCFAGLQRREAELTSRRDALLKRIAALRGRVDLCNAEANRMEDVLDTTAVNREGVAWVYRLNEMLQRIHKLLQDADTVRGLENKQDPLPIDSSSVGSTSIRDPLPVRRGI